MVNGLGGSPQMSSVLNTATKGVQKSQEKVAKAAYETVKSFADAANSVSDTSSKFSEAAKAMDSGAMPQVTSPPVDSPDVTSSIVDMKSGVAAYKANLEVVKVADEMSEALLDTMA